MMKKIMMMVVGAMAAVAAFAAAQNDLRVTFWTQGPDRYRDGSAVVDGELYALVWTKAGATFAGFAADGSLVDAAASQLVVAGPWAQDGRCRPILHLVDAAKASAYAAGTFALVCLDTRNADGTVGAPARDANGLVKLTVVNGSTTVAASRTDADGLSSSMNATGGVVIETASALPAGVPQPEITGLEMVDVNGEQMMKLKVKNTVPYLRYKAQPVGAEGRAEGAAAGVAANGAPTADREVEVLVPATGKQGFFRITRQ